MLELANGAQLGYCEMESDLCIIRPDGDFVGRVYGGMRHRLTRNGWLSRYKLTDAGRAALEED